MSFTLDISQFSHAVGFVVAASGKDCSEVLNKAGLTALIGGRGVKGALQRTPKADRARIKSDLERDRIAIKMAVKAIERQGQKPTRERVARVAKQIISRRQGGVSYTRGPGWNNAIVAMGGRGVRTNKRFAASEARHGSGQKATAESLVARIINTAPASERIGLLPLQAALNDTARDMIEYGTRKIQQRFNQVKP